MPEPPFDVCTVASPGYLPQARVMVDSVLAVDPEASVTLLYLGSAGVPKAERARVLHLDPRVEVLEVDEVGVEPDEVRKLGLMYSTQGLAGAMKARLIRHLLLRDRRPVIFVDADICVYRSMRSIADRSEETAALLTTHVGRPLVEAERPMLSAGVFNSGFLAIAPRGLELAEWWCERTARDCIFRPNRGLLWEQAWLGIAPAFFDVEVLRDRGVNTMARELLDHDIEWDGDGLPTIGGEPLTCYHFSGPYDPGSPEFLLAPSGLSGDVVVRTEATGFSGLSWLSLERRPGAARLSRQYAERLNAAGFDEEGDPPAFSRLDDGRPIHRAMRRAYRAGLMQAEREGGTLPPNPFSGDSEDALLEWLREVPEENEATGFSRLLSAMYEAYEGAPIIFPRVPGADAPAFQEWAEARLRFERRSLPQELVPPGSGGGSPPPPRGWLGGLGVRQRARRRGPGPSGSKSKPR